MSKIDKIWSTDLFGYDESTKTLHSSFMRLLGGNYGDVGCLYQHIQHEDSNGTEYYILVQSAVTGVIVRFDFSELIGSTDSNGQIKYTYKDSSIPKLNGLSVVIDDCQ